MHNNHIYNLISQITQEHRSLWRIKKFYLKDAGNCKKCKEMWEKINKQKEEQLRELLKLLNYHKV